MGVGVNARGLDHPRRADHPAVAGEGHGDFDAAVFGLPRPGIQAPAAPDLVLARVLELLALHCRDLRRLCLNRRARSLLLRARLYIGSAASRARVGPYVWFSVVSVCLQKK